MSSGSNTTKTNKRSIHASANGQPSQKRIKPTAPDSYSSTSQGIIVQPVQQVPQSNFKPGVSVPPFTSAPSSYALGKHTENRIDLVPQLRTSPQTERRFIQSLNSSPSRDDSHLKSSDSEYQLVRLTDFTCYRVTTNVRDFTLGSLNELGTNSDTTDWAFDGRLHLSDAQDGQFNAQGCSQTSMRVYGVRFQTISIEGYITHDNRPATAVFIRSIANQKQDVWYRLETPSQAYQRYHEPFLWLAEFVIYFVAFIEHQAQADLKYTNATTLDSFRKDFNHWLHHTAIKHTSFDSWRAHYPKTDFRHIVVTYFDFLWKESTDVCPAVVDIPLWREIDPRQLHALKYRPIKETMTICTHYAYKCFEDSFKIHLKKADMEADVSAAWQNRAHRMKMTCLDDSNFGQLMPNLDSIKCEQSPQGYQVGEVVAVTGDTTGPWQEASYYGYVQGITMVKGKRTYDLIWLYSVADTIIGGAAAYPFPNEMFMSDHCNCVVDSQLNLRTYDRDILGKVAVAFDVTDAESCGGLFVRQTYIVPDKALGKDVSFRSLQRQDFTCGCRRSSGSQDRHSALVDAFPVRSPVLYSTEASRFFEPAIVQEHLPGGRVQLRLLERRQRRDASAMRCELLETAQLHQVSAASIVRRCAVGRYAKQDVRRQDIPAPFAYDGTGDTWALTGYLDDFGDGQYRITEVTDVTSPPSFLEGLVAPCGSGPELPRMAGLSLFSGAGSFDRGLQEGGALSTKWAVEMDDAAAHAYRANLESPDETQIWWGSVNDHLKRGLRGKASSAIPNIGEVDLICGGSPCKGFSMATQDKSSNLARGYASLVATMVSYADFYRPAHLILENVPEMCHDVKGSKKGENVFKSVLASILGLGYQITIYMGDAWTQGSSQNRSRILIMATAPGLDALARPPQTHAHPEEKRMRAAGRTVWNGEYGFHTPLDAKVPHALHSARDSTGDLPRHDGMQRTTIREPSHRTPALAARNESMLKAIPRAPAAMNYVKAAQAGALSAGLRARYGGRTREFAGADSKAFQRVDPAALFPTVKTQQRYDCTRMGASMHWRDPRGMTLMEARRAQSIPDHEILIGSAADQFKQVGNGVDRKVSVALGLSLRKSWAAQSMRAYMERFGRVQKRA